MPAVVPREDDHGHSHAHDDLRDDGELEQFTHHRPHRGAPHRGRPVVGDVRSARRRRRRRGRRLRLRAFDSFLEAHRSAISRRTSLVVLGDGRGNGKDPRLPVFVELTRRARETVWLTPEPHFWQLGRCDLPLYAEYCDRVTGAGGVRTPHFDVVTHDHRLFVTHDLCPEDVDDDLTRGHRRRPLRAGWVRGSEMFERIFTGVVRTGAANALDSWEPFSRNMIRHLISGAPSPRPSPSLRTPPPLGAGGPDATMRPAPGSGGHGSIDDYASVHDRALGLVRPGSVLELGSCFGFLALRLSAAGHRTTASDVSAGTVRLLTSIAPRLSIPLGTLLADAARVPVVDGFADTVVVIHLLEHLDPDHGDKVVVEALRCARRGVVIAVPLEGEADEFSGHLRTISLDELRTWGRASHLLFEVAEHHGGWLVLHNC